MPTPRAEYERQRVQLAEELGQIAPEPLRSRLSDMIRPAITFTSSPPTEGLPPLASKFGGEPDVPIGFEWPYFQGDPLGFVAQVNLTELADLDLEKSLPESGLLSFWINEEESEEGSFGAWRVFHFQGRDWQKLQVPIHNTIENFPPTPLQPHIMASVANVWGSAEFYGEEFDRELGSALYDLCPRVQHQMFGFADNIQNDVRYEAEPEWNKFLHSAEARVMELSLEHDTAAWKDFELLLQIGGDDNAQMLWGDSGAIYFLIRKVDLEAEKFERCWFVFQCC